MDIFEEIVQTRRRVPAPAIVRPLFELLATRPPRDWTANETFEMEVRLARDAFSKDHPLGLRQNELDFTLEAPEDIYGICAKKLLDLAPYLKLAHGIKLGARAGTGVLTKWLKAHANRLRLFELSRRLSVSEIACLMHEQTSGRPLLQDLYDHPVHMYVQKLRLSTCHWVTHGRTGRLPWQSVVDYHNLFRGFRFGITGTEGFEVTVDHSRASHNTRGTAEYTGRTHDQSDSDNLGNWIDGELAFIVSYKGAHVMTIGVSPTLAGLIVTQIQLKRHKGNRWLFELPKPYFEYVLDRLLVACQAANIEMFLVTGESLRNEIVRLHNNEPLDCETAERIVRIYNQPLKELKRSRKRLKVNRLCYRLISPR